MATKSYMEMGYHVHTDKEIKGFFGPYRWLSNFHVCEVKYGGLVFHSSEAAYQAAKCKFEKDMILFQSISALEARRLGQQIQMREDWEAVKLGVMSQITFNKYANNLDIRKKLIDTGEAYLEELNHWNDVFWGKNLKGGGENHLGEILMNVRGYFKNQ